MKNLLPLLLTLCCLISCKKEAFLDKSSFEKTITNSLMIIEKPKGVENACQLNNKCIGLLCDAEEAGSCRVHECEAVACLPEGTNSNTGGRIALSEDRVNKIANEILEKMIDKGYVERKNSSEHLKFYTNIVKNHQWN